MTYINIAGIGGSDRFVTVNGQKIYVGASYNGGWRGTDKSLSFNMGGGAALARLNVMENSAIRYEPIEPNTGKSLSYAACWMQGYCDAEGHIAALPPAATGIYLHFQGFDQAGFEVHFGDYRMEWNGPEWSATLGVNVIDQDAVTGNGDHWAIIRVEAGVNNNPRFYWPDPATAGDYPKISRIVRTDRIALHDSGERWNPDFIADVDGLMSVLRVMDAAGINDSRVQMLSDIPPVTSPRLSPWPPDIYVDLCNRLGIDCYICIPHRMVLEHSPAHQDRTNTSFTGNILTAEAIAYVQRVDALLHDDLRIYVEYSNEYWNSAFDQFHETWSAATAAGWDTASGFHPSYFGAKINALLFRDLKAAFGNRAAARLICVVGTQAANTAITQRLLGGQRWLDEEGATDWFAPASVIDAVAIAPYLGSSWIETGTEAADFLAYIRQDPAPSQTDVNTYMVGRLQALGLDTQPINWINDQADLTDGYDLPLIMYEGGTHVLHFFSVAGVTTADVDEMAPWLTAFSYSMDHWALEEPILNAWASRGGGPYDSFSLFYRPNRFGAWGHYRVLGQVDPASAAKETWQANNPRWWDDWRDYGVVSS